MTIVTPDAHSLWLFTIASLALLLVPGPAVLYIVARSIEQGRLAGLVSDLGIHSATLVHVAAASLGLSAVLASSAIAFSIVKYAGAAYLIWIGVKKLLSRPAAATEIHLSRHKLSRLYREGFVVNLLNPKTAIFFFAVQQQLDQGLQPGFHHRRVLLAGRQCDRAVPARQRDVPAHGALCQRHDHDRPWRHRGLCRKPEEVGSPSSGPSGHLSPVASGEGRAFA